MNVQILKKNNIPEFAVIPFEDYQALIEAKEELEDIKESKDLLKAIKLGKEESIPNDVVNRLLDGENPVKVWREYRGIDQKTMANNVGITPSFLSQIESGTKEGSIKTRRSIAEFLNVDLDDLE